MESFGAGKTRSAAVLLAGLLVFDPDLKLMVVTKENVAAHAFAEHLVALGLPQEVQEKMGHLCNLDCNVASTMYLRLTWMWTQPQAKRRVLREFSLLSFASMSFDFGLHILFADFPLWVLIYIGSATHLLA